MGRALIRWIVITASAALPAMGAADAVDDRMRAEADEVNRRAPTMVDRSTRLDAAGYGNRLFFYHFTAMNHASTDSPAVRQKFAAQMREQAMNQACTGPVLRPYLDAGVTIKYVHFGSDHRRISEVVIKASDCEQPIRAPTPKKAGTAKPSPRPSVIKNGDTYEKVMESLSGSPSARKVLDGVLTTEFTDRSLVADPGGKGVCKLSFRSGVLYRCEGCKPGRFAGCGR